MNADMMRGREVLCLVVIAFSMFIHFLYSQQYQETKNYIGCFSGLTLTEAESGQPDAASCVRHCFSREMVYAGIHGRLCSCGNNIDIHRALANQHCTKSCENLLYHQCPDSARNQSLFKTFDGCFTDLDTSLFHKSTSLLIANEATCIEMCRNEHMTYAVISGNPLFCQCLQGEQYNATMAEGRTCSFTNETYKVRFQIRAIECSPVTATSCSDIFENGVITNGDYYIKPDVDSTNIEKAHCVFKDELKCGKGWFTRGEFCYKLNTDKLTFFRALENCRSTRSDLVSIHSDEELSFLKTIILGTAETYQLVKWYIGLFIADEVNYFTWTDASLYIFSKLKTFQPDSSVILSTEESYWTAVRPDGSLYPSVCKRKSNDDESPPNKTTTTSKAAPRRFHESGNKCLNITEDLNSVTTFFSEKQALIPCLQYCLGKHYWISAAHGRVCKCFREEPAGVSLPWDRCNLTCPGNRHQLCGGHDQNLYFLVKGDSMSKASHCREIEFWGLSNEAYLIVKGVNHSYEFCKRDESRLCPVPWITHQGGCYLFVANYMTLSRAINYCMESDASLASVGNPEEEAFLTEVLENVRVLNSHEIWTLGIFDNTFARTFLWSDGQPITEDDDWELKTEHLGYKMNRQFFEKKWIPTHRNRVFPFICEKSSRILGTQNVSSADLLVEDYVDITVSLCLELCRGQNYPYALLSSESCYCSNSILSNRMSNSGCGACSGNVMQLCGDKNTAVIYDIQQYNSSTASSCETLFRNGIHIHGTYQINDTKRKCSFLDETQCGPEWIGFQGHCYYLGSSAGFSDVNHVCKNMTSELTSIWDKGEHDFLKMALRGRRSIGMKTYSLVGLADTYNIGCKSWSDGTIFFDLPWAQNSPGTLESTVLQKTKELDYPLKDMLITKDMSLSFVCKKQQDYVGCFSKPTSGAVRLLVNYSSMSLTLCRQLCFGKLYNYSFTGPGECYCSATVEQRSEVVASPKSCDHACAANSLQTCGGGNHFSVHQLGPRDAARNCEDLLRNAVFLEGTYLLNSAGMKQTGCGYSDLTDCPSSFIGKDNLCYRFFPRAYNFDSARETCYDRDSLLAAPVDDTQRQFVANITSFTPFFAKFGWFVGLRGIHSKNGHLTTSAGHMYRPLDWTLNVSLDSTLSYSERQWKAVGTSVELAVVCEQNPAYLGNFNLSGKTAISFQDLTYPSVTQCVELCRGRDLRYAGVRRKDCFCYRSDERPQQRITVAGSKVVPCPLHPHQPCGGELHQALFDIDFYRPASSCDDLALYGVAETGWYYITRPIDEGRILVQCFFQAPYENVLALPPTAYSDSDNTPGNLLKLARVTLLYNSGSFWAASSRNDVNKWIEVNLSSVTTVTGLQTQGVKTEFRESWITFVTITYSIDGNRWTAYTEKGETKLKTNSNGHLIVTKHFSRPFQARLVRIYPVSWNTEATLRFEVLGVKEPLHRKNLYIGCYIDYDRPPADDGGLLENATAVSCLQHCYSRFHPFSGLQTTENNRLVCRCADQRGKYGRVNDSFCSARCGEKFCGFRNTTALYRNLDVFCDRPPEVKAAHYERSVNIEEDVATYRCDEKSTSLPNLAAVAVSTCLPNKRWSLTPDGCKDLWKMTMHFTMIENNRRMTNPSERFHSRSITDCVSHCHLFSDCLAVGFFAGPRNVSGAALVPNCEVFANLDLSALVSTEQVRWNLYRLDRSFGNFV